MSAEVIFDSRIDLITAGAIIALKIDIIASTPIISMSVNAAVLREWPIEQEVINSLESTRAEHVD